MVRRRNAGADNEAEDPRTSPISFANGMFTAGSATTIPDGFTLLTRNMVVRPNRICARPPFVYDGLTAVNGFMIWEDLTNQQTRFLALTTNGNLYMKAASGETWGGAITTGLAAGLRLTDYANYRGKLYFMLDDGAGNPTAAAMFDGTNVTVTPFTSAIFSRTISTFIDRLFLSYPRVTITPQANGSSQQVFAYDATHANWVKTNVSASNIQSSSTGTTICRVSPQSTSINACSMVYNRLVAGVSTGTLKVLASDSSTAIVWRSDLRPVDGVVAVPMTLEIVAIGGVPQVRPFAIAVGYLMVQNNRILRCVTAGNTDAAPVVYSTTIGATTVDGTVVWLTESLDVLASLEFTLPNATTQLDWVTKYVAASVPPSSSGLNLEARIKFYNTTTTALTTLVSVDISLKDGLADSDPRKSNRGQQITLGSYYYPFFNAEAVSTRTNNIEAIIWSETTDPSNIRAANTFEPKSPPVFRLLPA